MISSGNPNDSYAQDPLFPVIAEAVITPQLHTLSSASLPAPTPAARKAPPSSQPDNQNPLLSRKPSKAFYPANIPTRYEYALVEKAQSFGKSKDTENSAQRRKIQKKK